MIITRNWEKIGLRGIGNGGVGDGNFVDVSLDVGFKNPCSLDFSLDLV